MLKQQQFATLVGRSRRTIQAVELGNLNLGVDLAERISLETGVHLSWLLKGDAEQPPRNKDGQRYTKADYEHAQVSKRAAYSDPATMDFFGSVLAAHGSVLVLMTAMIAAHQNANKGGLVDFRIIEFAQKLADEFGWINEETKNRLSAYQFPVHGESYISDGNYSGEPFLSDPRTYYGDFVRNDAASFNPPAAQPEIISEAGEPSREELPPPSPKRRVPRSRRAGEPPPSRGR